MIRQNESINLIWSNLRWNLRAAAAEFSFFHVELLNFSQSLILTLPNEKLDEDGREDWDRREHVEGPVHAEVIVAGEVQFGGHEFRNPPYHRRNGSGNAFDGRREQFSEQDEDDGVEADGKGQVKEDDRDQGQVFHPLVRCFLVFTHDGETDAQKGHGQTHSQAANDEQEFATQTVRCVKRQSCACMSDDNNESWFWFAMQNCSLFVLELSEK